MQTPLLPDRAPRSPLGMSERSAAPGNLQMEGSAGATGGGPEGVQRGSRGGPEGVQRGSRGGPEGVLPAPVMGGDRVTRQTLV
uniref:Uncharacterized protein n=1 Tax=Knipowitschia caucasica TaxID=637954 RepID=A0AAV2JIW8_KNICA